MGLVAAQAGAVDAAREAAGRARELAPGAKWVELMTASALGHAELALGHNDGAVANLQPAVDFARAESIVEPGLIRCVVDLMLGGVCHRFPDLKLVSVESGVGWISSMLETCDWQWRNGGVLDEHPEYDLLPSEYFQANCYVGTFLDQDGIAVRTGVSATASSRLVAALCSVASSGHSI